MTTGDLFGDAYDYCDLVVWDGELFYYSENFS